MAFWLPQPELISSTGGLKPSDRIDVLLTVNFGEGGDKKFPSTQTTLQNVEVFAIGTVEQAVSSSATPANSAAESAAQGARNPARGGDRQALILLVDHQVVG